MTHGIQTHNLSYSRRHALPVELMLFINYFFCTEVCILLLPISHMGVCKHHLRSPYILRYQSDGGSWFRDRAMTVIVELLHTCKVYRPSLTTLQPATLLTYVSMSQRIQDILATVVPRYY